MAEKAPSELTTLRREFKEATGKNPSPKLTADDLTAKIAEAKAAPPEAGAVEPPPADADKPEAPAKVSKAKPKPEAEPEAPKGTALLDHDDPNAAASHEGVEIVRGKNGLYLAPLAFVDALVPHGFRVVGAGK
jgi:hypothetical protein